jgi:hypothetical protein
MARPPYIYVFYEGVNGTVVLPKPFREMFNDMPEFISVPRNARQRITLAEAWALAEALGEHGAGWHFYKDGQEITPEELDELVAKFYPRQYREFYGIEESEK